MLLLNDSLYGGANCYLIDKIFEKKLTHFKYKRFYDHFGCAKF